MRMWCQFGAATVHTGNAISLDLYIFSTRGFLPSACVSTISVYDAGGLAKIAIGPCSHLAVVCMVAFDFLASLFFVFNTIQISRLIQFLLHTLTPNDQLI